MTPTSPPAAKGVTAAMVEAAMEAWFAQPDREDDMSLERSLRACLTASLSLPPPGEGAPTELINRLQDAIEGECEGLAIDEDQARAILEHVGYPSTLAAPELGAVKDGMVLVPKAALDWLDGSGPDAEGRWFEEFPEGVELPTERYWWRTPFRKMLAAGRTALSSGSEKP